MCAEYRTSVLSEFEWQQAVSDRVAAPAGGESKGTRYLITTGSGDFTGYSNYIATAKQANPSDSAHWYFDAPIFGMVVFLQDEKHYYNYNGAFWKIFDYIINVKDYGAVGDGTTDDTAAIQAAIDAIPASGATIGFVDVGDYLISSALTFPVNACLYIGKGARIKKSSSATITINGSFTAGLYQVFLSFSAGNINFASGVIHNVYTDWFGFDETDNGPIIQMALDSLLTPRAGTVWLPTKTIPVTTTVTLRYGISLKGGDCRARIWGWSPNPRIEFAPTVADTDLFQLEVVTGYVKPLSVENFGVNAYDSLVPGVNVNARYAFNLSTDGPNGVLINGMDISYFEEGIVIVNGLDTKVMDTTISNCTTVGVRVKTGVTTTTKFDAVYISWCPWGVILEDSAVYDIVFKDCIFESLSVGGIDIYKANETVSFYNCYSENVPTEYVGSPIIQAGVNGTTETTYLNVNVYGGVWAGRNGGAHADSSFINADAVEKITVFGSLIKRVGHAFITTANTKRVTSLGTEGISITATTGINDKTALFQEKDGTVGIGTVSSIGKCEIAVNNEVNKYGLIVSQLDTTNNPICAEINNDGTNHGLYLHQDEVLATNKYGLYVYSNVAQVNSALLFIKSDNASSSAIVSYIINDGTGTALQISQNGVLALSDYHAVLFIYSNAVQVNSPLGLFWQDNASSTANVLEMDNDGTGHGLIITQNGNLATGKYGLYIDNNGTPTDGAGRCIRLDGCTITGTGAILGYIAVNIDGTQRAVPYYAIA